MFRDVIGFDKSFRISNGFDCVVVELLAAGRFAVPLQAPRLVDVMAEAEPGNHAQDRVELALPAPGHAGG